MSSCLSGGSRGYGFDIEILKSPSSTSTVTSHSSSSTLSESGNSQLTISTRKPRTPRKRPNQTYNEAAALLSTAYPNIFSAKHLTSPCKFPKQNDILLNNSSELLLPFRVFDNSGFLLHQPIPEKPSFKLEPALVNSSEKEFLVDSLKSWNGHQDEFDVESILDQELEEGIDSIMKNQTVTTDLMDESEVRSHIGQISSTCYGYPVGLGFGGNLDFRYGMRGGGLLTGVREVDEREWLSSSTVDVVKISPKLHKSAREKKIDKRVEVKSLESAAMENLAPKQQNENSIPKSNSGLLLKLNCDAVMSVWSDRGSPFSGEISGHEIPEDDVHARLAQIDLFSEGGGLREASVQRYKEKRRMRLFSKKIRYEVRKVNADRRPRMKGRFVRRPNSPMNEPR